MDRQSYEVSKRGRLWLPTVKQRDHNWEGWGPHAPHRGVTHLELRRCLSNGTGGEDLGIGELWVETNWGAAMDYSCGSGKAEDI
eukprot:scaffold10203_cov143-Isochrysis_galbana.AAC.2